MVGLCLFVGVIVIGFIAYRYIERKEKESEHKTEEKVEEKVEEIPVPIIREVKKEIVPVFATVTIPKERLIVDWDTERYGINNEMYSRKYAEKRLKEEIANQLWEFVTVVTEEDMINLTVKYEARVMVVKS